MAAAAATGPSVSTSPLNINDNKKRWVVFGLALKDLVDQIRPFEEKEIQTEYATVKASHGIDSQGASGRLTFWPTFLKYENINGNDAIPKKHGKYNYSAFDCRVTSHVDFAKLYLKNYMAKFTMFDERCDASAVLILLGQVPVFSVAVQKAAANVLQDRNAWAHCAFQDWDAAKFRQSFEDMERLVNALGMPVGDKANLLAELKVWETAGPSLCMNTSVDPALLQMVDHCVNELMTDVDMLVFDVECDKEKMKKALQDVRTEVKELEKRLSVVEGEIHILQNERLSAVEQRVTKLEDQRTSSLPQISIEIANCEAEISSFAARHDADTRQWLFEDFKKWFLSPGDSRAYVLLGDAGVGKSVIAAALAQRVRSAGHLGAAYFCCHNDHTRNDPRNLLGTIASQLCKCNLQYSNIVGGEGGVRMMLANSKLGVLELFTKLLQEPLGKCTTCEQRKLVIIDALDETEYESRDDFLDLVMHRFPRLPKWVLFFITSRPEDTVQFTLKNYQPCMKLCAGSGKHLHVYQQHEQDIKRFLEKRVDFSRLPYTVEDITKKCSGLFLYAFYMVKELSDLVRSGNVAELNELFPGNIDDFFRENFKRVFDKLGKNFFRKLFGCVVAAPSPLPRSFIPFLLQREKSNLDVQEVIDTVSLFLVLRTSDQTYKFLHNLVPSWLTDWTKARRFYIDRAEAGKYLKKIVQEFLPSVINVASKEHSSIEPSLLDYVLGAGVRVLCRYDDADSMKIVYSCLKSYQFIQKRLKNSPIEVYSVIGDLKLSVRCQTLGDTEKEILQEVCRCLERNINTLMECPHLLPSCLRMASKAVKSNMTIPDEVSTTWMEWSWFPYHTPKSTPCERFVAWSPDKKLLAEVKDGRISLFKACSLERLLGPVELGGIHCSHLAFSPFGDFVLFGRLNKAFSVERGRLEEYFPLQEFDVLNEWCSFTLDQQHIVVKRKSLPSPTCWSCLLNYLCLWAKKEIVQSQGSKPLCGCFPQKLTVSSWKVSSGSPVTALRPLIDLLRRMGCKEWCSLLEKVQLNTQDVFFQLPTCERCKSSERYEELTLKEVRQFIIDHYAKIFKYQVWNRRTAKPVLDEIFSLGVELDPFMYLCHDGTAFEVCGTLFTGIEKSLSLGNIALLVTVCYHLLFRLNHRFMLNSPNSEGFDIFDNVPSSLLRRYGYILFGNLSSVVWSFTPSNDRTVRFFNGSEERVIREVKCYTCKYDRFVLYFTVDGLLCHMDLQTGTSGPYFETADEECEDFLNTLSMFRSASVSLHDILDAMKRKMRVGDTGTNVDLFSGRHSLQEQTSRVPCFMDLNTGISGPNFLRFSSEFPFITFSYDDTTDAIQKASALWTVSTTMGLELQNFPNEDKKAFFSGSIPCLSSGAIWVAKTRVGDTGTTVDLFRGRHSLQEQNSHNPEHVIKEVAQFGFTNDHSLFVYLSVDDESLHALSLQSGTILQSTSGVSPSVFTPEGQAGYLFHANDEDKTIFLKDFPVEFLKHLLISSVKRPMQANFVSDDTFLVLCADSSVMSFQATDNPCPNSSRFVRSSDFGALGLQHLKKCTFSLDGNLIAAHSGAKITLYGISGSGCCEFLCTVFEPGYEFTVAQIIFSADSAFLFYCILKGGNEPFAFVWDVRGKFKPTFFDPPVLHPENFCCCFTMDNKIALCTEFQIEIFDHTTSPCRLLTRLAMDVIYGEADKVTCCTVSPKNDLLACCVVDRILIYSLDNSTIKPVSKLPRAHLGEIEFCRFLKGGRYIISYVTDGAVFLWDVSERTAVSFIRTPYERVNITFLTVSPEEDRVVGYASFERFFEIKLYGLKSEMLPLQFQLQGMTRQNSALTRHEAMCSNVEQIAEEADISNLEEDEDYMIFFPSDDDEDSDGDGTENLEADQCME